RRYLETGRTPMRCHALSASCFVDSWGNVFPCTIYDRRIGSLRDVDYDLARLWSTPEADRLEREIFDYRCPQCWTPCEAYPNTIAGSENMLAHLPVTVPALAASGNVLVVLKAMALESFVLAGLAMFLLVHHHTRDAGAALLAGAAYTFAPWRVHALPQPQYLGAQYLPLALLAVDCWLERRRVRALAALAAALALQALA